VPRVTSNGNVERFDKLFTDHIDIVLAYALARVDPETAKDAVADTFLVAWRRLGEVPDPARSWLLGVTRRTLANQRRGLRRQRLVVERMTRTWVGPESSGESVEGFTERSTVIAALNGLRANDRELLFLVAWDGLDHKEAAEVLNCSPRAFAVRLHRARRRLESALSALDGQPVSDDVPTDHAVLGCDRRPGPDRGGARDDT
jgi:RNA polymerase sigma-70 factor, ECF subfamily